MRFRIRRRMNERGIALLLTLLLALLVVSLAIGVLLMMTSTTLVTRFHMSEAIMSNLAAGGLEQARDTLNGTPNLLPRPVGHDTIELNATIRDANDAAIPGLRRSTFAGYTGSQTGQAGLFASVLSVISNARGPVVIRRADYKQKSFASFERFYHTWTFGSWNQYDNVFGPVHSNSEIRLSSGSPGTRFWGRVTSVGSITNASNGTFYSGYQTGAQYIPFPTNAQITALQPLAAGAGTVVAGDGRMTATDPELRIEFVAIDLNGDGDTRDADEGFFRVFRMPPGGSDPERNYITARKWLYVSGSGWGASNSTDPNLFSPNCGGRVMVAGTPTWMTANSIAIADTIWPDTSTRRSTIRNALSGLHRRCYLGGDKRLHGDRWIVEDNFATNRGSWSRWAGWGASAPPALVNAIAAQGVHPSTDAAQVALTFWPIGQAFNPGWRGVIYVTGSVAVSGRVRGQVTLVANGNIMIADDITYVQAPNTTCADILGMVSRQSILLEDNNVNSPFRVNDVPTNSFDDTPDETIHAFLLALDEVGGENLNPFSSESPIGPEESCGFTTASSRGCRFLVGGVAQRDNNTSYRNNVGWHDQDHYDQCGSSNPPPYYPTTGSFTRHRYYEIDPVGFNPVTWFNANQ